MSKIKEQIIGAVNIMNEEDAEKLWDLILSTFTLGNVAETEPDSDEKEILDSYYNADSELQPAYSQEDVLNILGLK